MLPRHQISRFVAVAALLGGLASYSPAYAQNNGMSPAANGVPDATDTSDTSTSASAPSSASPATNTAMSSSKHAHEDMGQKVEDRIKTLHAKLKITPDQESAWGNVASAMRDNESNMSSLIQDRHSKDNPTALEDMQSYQKIAQAHADGLGKVLNAFEPLYNSMSDSQKANADNVFSGMGMHHDGKKHHAHTKSSAQ